MRTGTNGDVRLHHTPGQWDAIPTFVERNVNEEENIIEAQLEYPDYNFTYSIRAEAQNETILLSVHLENPLPEELEGLAGFNLEFLPSAYFEKAYLMDEQSGVFPLYPSGPMNVLPSGETDGSESGTFDDRWAFTTETTALNFGSAAALAAASRTLRGYNEELAEESLQTAASAWEKEQNREPKLFRHGNTTGGNVQDEEVKATVELLITTEDEKYAKRLNELLPVMEDRFMFNAGLLVRAIPYMNEEYSDQLEEWVRNYSENLEQFTSQNPFGVPITEGGWAGGGTVIGFALNNYLMHKAFPEIIDKEHVYRGLNYIYGTHPASNISFVSGVGTKSKEVAYGMNRADYSFIAGGIVPGVLILPPDFPENKEDWPFLWGENEYVISVGSSYLYLVHAVNDLLNQEQDSE